MTYEKVGFTGTRTGLTAYQFDNLLALLKLHAPSIKEGHHGDCVGADANFHALCGSFGIPVIIHPPAQYQQRAFCVGPIKRMEPEKSFYARNRDIVDSTDILIACPATTYDHPKGGTWYTINYARSKGKIVHVIYPRPVELDDMGEIRERISW